MEPCQIVLTKWRIKFGVYTKRCESLVLHHFNTTGSGIAQSAYYVYYGPDDRGNCVRVQARDRASLFYTTSKLVSAFNNPRIKLVRGDCIIEGKAAGA